MVQKMIINGENQKEVRIAVIDNGRLIDFDIETQGTEKNKGNIYKAKVIDVEPSLNAAFVDYGADKQGFLTAGDVDPRIAQENGLSGTEDITSLLKPKQEILVQITKDEVGQKGAVLTTYLSLAGRYLVLMPESDGQGVSRKLDEDERDELRETIAALKVPEGMGIIVRTAGRGRPRMDLVRDLKVLLRLWKSIKHKAGQGKSPRLIFKEQDVVIRALRDYFSREMDEVVVDSDETYDRAAEYVNLVMPKHSSVLSRYVERRPIFHHYRIEEQLEALYLPRVELKSGGSIVIEPTEALVAIDVNSGKQKTGDHEQTALQSNLEAAREIALQLKLRDLGGIIVTDFIDMSMRKNQSKVENEMKDAVRNDKARIKVSRISRNGTLELTRQRIRTALFASVFGSCTTCAGTGRVINHETHAAAIIRKLRDRASRGDLALVKIRVGADVANILKTDQWTVLQKIEQENDFRIEVLSDSTMSIGTSDFTFEADPNKTAIEPPEANFGPVDLPDELKAELLAAQAEEDAELAAAEATVVVEKAQKRHRRREGGRRRDGRESSSRKLQPVGAPSFEMIDPADLGLAPKRKKPDTRDGAEVDPVRKRRRRGGKRRRGGLRSEQTSGNTDARRNVKPVEVAPKKKRGFWAWLKGESA